MTLSPKVKTVPLKPMSGLKHLFETNVASGTFQLGTHNSSAILFWSPIVRGLRGSLPKSGPLDFATKNTFLLFFVGQEALVGIY